MDVRNLIENKVFSVSEFNNFVNDILTPLVVTIEGEISEWKVSRGNLVWFTLKDEKQSLKGFSLTYRIRMPVEVGMRVKVHGRPKIFGKSGSFVFDTEYLELSGEGSIQKSFLLLKARLEKEGLFAIERKRVLPRFPKTIGLITSEGAAAYTDFLKHLSARLGGLEIIFIPVAVQGKTTVREVVAAFDYFNRSKNRPDVVVLTRGGGSLEDLQYFNSEEIVRAVFGSASPVICAIGHERDVTLCELSADVRAATPTAAAQLAVADRQELLSELSNINTTCKLKLTKRLQTLKHQLNFSTQELLAQISEKTRGLRMVFEKIQAAFPQLVSHLELLQQRAKGLKIFLISLAPQNVLARGYSIVKKSGKILKDTQDIKIGDKLDIQFARGALTAGVEKITND
ncbi:MAG: exodeoxyribonuclease VII large subunit [Patescibacteria group bacterium]|nr:exodeoxyribonuclease VII large subunit [Patescibacteria group bacterium]